MSIEGQAIREMKYNVCPRLESYFILSFWPFIFLRSIRLTKVAKLLVRTILGRDKAQRLAVRVGGRSCAMDEVNHVKGLAICVAPQAVV